LTTGTRVASLYASIGADVSGFQKGAASVKGDLTGMSGGLKSTLGQVLGFASAAGLAGTAIYKMGQFIGDSVNAAADAQRVDAQLAAVLKSTAGAAGMTHDELNALATSLEHETTYSDESIKSSEALLLTFTKIGGNILPQAEQAVLDMSTALGTDLAGSSIQLGKALNDPINGITALRRVGVSFTADQVKLIKSLVDSGKTLEAQKLILHELSVEFGGSAAAAVDTYDGKLQQMHNSVDDLQEVIGNELLPVMSDGVGVLNTSAQGWTMIIDNWKEAHNQGEDLRFTLGFLGEGLGFVEDGIAAVTSGDFSAFLGDVDKTSRKAAEGVGTLNDALGDSQETLQDLSKSNSDYIKQIADLSQSDQNYADKRRDLGIEIMKAQAEVDLALSQGYSAQGSHVTELQGHLDDLRGDYDDLAKQQEDDMHRMELAMLEQELAVGGLQDWETDALIAQGVQWGIYSDTAITEMRQARAEVATLAGAINAMPTAHNVNITIKTMYKTEGQPSSGTTYLAPPRTTTTSTTTHSTPQASGGSWMIPPGYGYEGYQFPDGRTASAGERVTVTPTAQTYGMGSGSDPIDYNRLARAIRDAMAMSGG
jgi:hypothetical protein